MNFGGMNVITNELMVDYHTRQVRFPRSRRQRIRKKWRKNPGNWRTTTTPQTTVYKTPYGLVMHPAMLQKLKDQLEKKASE